MTFKNPIIRGYFPDPSVCKAGGRYYLVASSFQYFPGVPLFESEDLINWRQIGYCLTRKSQLPLDKVESSCGIFAPTIRFNNGRFYMTTTNVTSGGNFYVYTDNIYGEWSEPVYVEQEGIDPSFYFENNRAYFMSNGHDKDGNSAIIQSEINIETGELLTEPKPLWGGTGGRYLESPHLYKINNFYYLMAAEGGTEYGHMVTYARGEGLWGPFEPYAANPVLTNRNLGGYSIQGVGHADLISDESGNWWLFHLGFRQIHRWLTFHHLGREVFLMPVDFNDDGWFTVGEKGITTEEVVTDKINTTQKFNNTFNTIEPLDRRFLRSYNEENFVFAEDVIKIKSAATGDTLDSWAASPAFVGFHQKEFNMELSVQINATDGEAGVTVYMDENHHYDLCFDGSGVKLKLNVGDIKHLKTQIPASGSVTLKIISDAINYEFFCGEISLGKAQTRYLSSEVAGGFTGVVIGLYSQYGAGKNFNEFREFKLIYKQ